MILDFYSVKFLVWWIVGKIGNLGETWWNPWLSVIIKLFMTLLSSPLIIRLFPYLDYHESVILRKTRLKVLTKLMWPVKTQRKSNWLSPESRRPRKSKAQHYHTVCVLSPFLVVSLLNRFQKSRSTSSARWLQNKIKDLTMSRTSKSPRQFRSDWWTSVVGTGHWSLWYRGDPVLSVG